MITRKNGVALFMSVACLTLASCESDHDDGPKSGTVDNPRKLSTETNIAGVAGGVIEETVEIEAKVADIDADERELELVDADGNKAEFTVGPEVRNFDQLHVGDKIVATLQQRMTVYVRKSTDAPDVTYSAAVAAAPKGAKPGVLVDDNYHVVATVTEIDTVTRVATLKFADGELRKVNVRPDVDLKRYQVGDSVVIDVATSLSVVTSKP